MRKRKRPRLVDRLELRFSSGKRVDDLWIGVLSSEPEPILRRIEEALNLIRVHDRLRYNRLSRDLERVWVRDVPGMLGSFDKTMRACQLDRDFIVAEGSSPELIAAVIVHEATHARLDRCGIEYKEELRSRIEAVCFRRELAFGAKLPDGEDVRARAARSLEHYADSKHWTNAAMAEWHDQAGLERLRQLGMPEWLVRSTPFLRDQRLRIRNFAQRVARIVLRR